MLQRRKVKAENHTSLYAKNPSKFHITSHFKLSRQNFVNPTFRPGTWVAEDLRCGTVLRGWTLVGYIHVYKQLPCVQQQAKNTLCWRLGGPAVDPPLQYENHLNHEYPSLNSQCQLSCTSVVLVTVTHVSLWLWLIRLCVRFTALSNRVTTTKQPIPQIFLLSLPVQNDKQHPPYSFPASSRFLFDVKWKLTSFLRNVIFFARTTAYKSSCLASPFSAPDLQPGPQVLGNFRFLFRFGTKQLT